MIAVTFHERRQVPCRMFPEKEMIILVALGMFPHIESLVNHQHPQTVAGIEKLFGRRVMAGADGIEAVFFQQTHLAHFRTVISGCP